MTITEASLKTPATVLAPDPATSVAPATTAQPKRRPGLNTETLALGAIFIAMFAFAAAIFAVGLASRAIDEHEAVLAAGGAGGGAAAVTVEVSLTEFAIMPDPMTAPAGATLAVVNDGAVPHSLSVEGLVTPDLLAGESANLDISSLAPGTYAVICAIVGHKENGMETTLTIT